MATVTHKGDGDDRAMKVADGDSAVVVRDKDGEKPSKDGEKPTKDGENQTPDPEKQRMLEDVDRTANWKRWGPYLSERQWGTVREDYSKDGNCWEYFTHDAARSRAYRWGEDGIAGVSDRQCRLCLSMALWNTRDMILKERLFGLTGPEGNHGEDVKELYYYLDSTPSHSYMKYLYKYPRLGYPYSMLVQENAARGNQEMEFELEDTGALDGGWWDVQVEYSKASPNDLLMEVTVTNCSSVTDTLFVVPTLWYRNTWVWGCSHEGCGLKPKLKLEDNPEDLNKFGPNLHLVKGKHETLGENYWAVDQSEHKCEMLFTENETNQSKLYDVTNDSPYVKDALHRYIIQGELNAVNPQQRGTKVGANYKVTLTPGGTTTIRTRLCSLDESPNTNEGYLTTKFTQIMDIRKKEADAFYNKVLSPRLTLEQKLVSRQALAGLLWTKQFYHYSVRDWLSGDGYQPPPPEERKVGRNSEWQHLFNRDIISMPDKWEYPWYASWDLAFHMVALALVDVEFVKDQLLLFLREWYMHPNGQIPAYEFAMGDVNPPVHAWAVMNVYRAAADNKEDKPRIFLAKAFQKLTLNFTWWVNRKDPEGRNLFGGGFLGLDNIGLFDRSQPMPFDGTLEQADGTAWMAFFCVTMLDMALTLAENDIVYEDMASKFFEHFILIMDAMNSTGQGSGLWDDQDGFYYDYIRRSDGKSVPLKVRSLVGLVPLFAVLVLERDIISEKMPGFFKRSSWFIRHRPDLASKIAFMESGTSQKLLLSVPTRDQLMSVLKYLLDEDEFLAPHGIRSLSKVHKNKPFVYTVDGKDYKVSYIPGESDTQMFGGNSNWRGPIWIPMNFLIITSLKRYHYFYGSTLKVECPRGSGVMKTLEEVAIFLAGRLSTLFLPDDKGRRPCHGDSEWYKGEEGWKDLVLFYEFFDGDTGRGCGATHQTGWSALIANCLNITLKYSHAGLTPRLTN